VWGKCDGIVLSAPPHSHRFGRAVVVARPPVSNFTLSLVGPAQGLAAWLRGGCTTAMEEGPNQPGPVLASILRGGAFGKPLALTSPATRALSSNAVARPGGGGTVSWSPYVLPPANTTSSIRVAANGTLGPVLSGPQIPSGLVPATIDGAGDQILASAYWSAFPGLQGGVVVRPVGGGADQPAPSPYGGLADAPTGRAFALAWNTNPSTFALSIWRP
jgi:hypothetical protein